MLVDGKQNNVLDGKYVELNLGQNVNTFGQYAEGKKTGLWKEFYESGSKKSEINYEANLRKGKASFWAKSEKLVGQYNFEITTIKGIAKEVMHGKQSKFYDNGTASEKSNYNLGKKDGLFEEWYENGNKKTEIQYKNHLVWGVNKSWHIDGKPKQDFYLMQVFDSTKNYWQAVYDGDYKTYNYNGNPEIIGKYKNGKKEGLFVTYYNNQKESEIIYKNRFKVGNSTSWHRNGNFSQLENYIIVNNNGVEKSVLNGLCQRFGEDNSLLEKAMYKLGKKDGQWNEFFRNDSKARETNYCDSLKCGENIWYNEVGAITDERF